MTKLNSDVRYITKAKEVNSKSKKKAKFNPASVPVYALEDAKKYGLTPKQTQKVWQHYINTGLVWKLSGWYGRTASNLLEEGYVKYPKKRTYDYYGTPIPTASEIKKSKLK